MVGGGIGAMWARVSCLYDLEVFCNDQGPLSGDQAGSDLFRLAYEPAAVRCHVLRLDYTP